MYVFKGDITFPKSDTYDIGVDADIMLNRNNRSQINAIRTALEERFTLIQGPPGMCQLPSVFFIQAFKHNYIRVSYIYCGWFNCTVYVQFIQFPMCSAC